MSSSAPLRLTPGRLTALWLVLRSLAKLGRVARRDGLIAIASRSALRSGGLPVRDGLELACRGGFVSGDDDLALTSLGDEVLALTAEEEPNSSVLRVFTSVLVLQDPPIWVAYWQGDPSALSLLLTDSERQVLAAAELGEPGSADDLDAWAWWNALRIVPLETESADFRKLLGDAAEQLSLAYERQRLAKEGYTELARRVRWVARESAAYGFDILSFAGTSFDSANPTSRLAIEVKAMARSATDRFSLHLTIHEYKTSIALKGRYVFHLWDAVRGTPNPVARSSEPIVMQISQIQEHLPGPTVCDGPCDWDSASATVILGAPLA